MRPLKIIIIDDEKNAVESIITIIKNFCENVEIAGFAFGASDGIELAKKTKPDLIFVDIEMKDGTGFDVATTLKDTLSLIVFVTAFEQYAIKAFKANAVDYILKPVSIVEIQQVIEKAQLYVDVQNKNNINQIQKPAFSEKISIPTSTGLLIIDVTRILYLEADGRYSTFYFIDHEPIVVSKNLGEIEAILDPSTFFRCHHSALVNMNYVTFLNIKEGNFIEMQNGAKVALSRRKKDDFIKFIESK